MGFLSRLFGRPPADIRASQGIWRPGELAVCITDTWWPRSSSSDPHTGDVLRVAAVHDEIRYGMRLRMLSFQEKAADVLYSASGFRKPVADNHAAETDFAEQLKKIRRRPAPARTEKEPA